MSLTTISPTKASGGYILAAVPLVRTGFTRHTAALDRPVSPVSVHALNMVQATPWRINTWLLDIAQEAFTKGIVLPGVGQEELPPRPPRLEDAVWAALSDADRAAHSAKRRDAHKKRAKARGKFAALVEKLMVAERMRTAERLWFPHTLDFRGRMYP